LAKDLFASRFAEIVARYEAVQGIIPQLRLAKEVEPALEALFAEQKQRPHRVRQLLAATYYIRDVIADAQDDWMKGRADRITNYIELIEQIEIWRQDQEEKSVALVTFNYDTLLEKAIQSIIGQRFVGIDDYIENPTPYSVFKLHGSINWWTGIVHRDHGHPMTMRHWADRILQGTRAPDPLGTFLVAEAEDRSSEAMIPAIALPIVTKTDRDFACPPAHLHPLREMLPRADRVLVIGWRGAEGHFYALWKDSFRPGQFPPKRVLVVDTDAGVHEAWQNLKTSAHWLPEGVLFKGGFSSFIGSDALAQFLAQPLPRT
jgi:hypothetical protein